MERRKKSKLLWVFSLVLAAVLAWIAWGNTALMIDELVVIELKNR